MGWQQSAMMYFGRLSSLRMTGFLRSMASGFGASSLPLSLLAVVVFFLQEGDEVRPAAAGLGGRFVAQHVQVLFAEHHGLAADGLIEFLAVFDVVEVTELVDVHAVGLDVGFLEEVREPLFALLLQFALLAAQYGLYLVLGLGRVGKS